MTTTVKITREIPTDVPRAFAWLTDYEPADVERAGGNLIAKREIVSRSGNVVRMEGEHRAFGRVVPSVYEVTLAPPDRWTSRVIAGPRKGSVTTYRLAPGIRAGTSRLDVEYQMEHEDAAGRFLLRFGKPLVARNLRAMWASYEKAMRDEGA